MYDYDDYIGTPYTCYDCGEDVGDNAVSSTINDELNKCTCWTCYVTEQINNLQDRYIAKYKSNLFWKSDIEIMDDYTLRWTVGLSFTNLDVNRSPGECDYSGNEEPYRIATKGYVTNDDYYVGHDMWLWLAIDEAADNTILSLIHNYGQYREYKITAQIGCCA